MYFGPITVANLRCLERIEYQPTPQINLIYGPNGSGKTSILEAIAIASFGKSFLSNRSGDIVRFGAPGLSVNAHCISNDGTRSIAVVRKFQGQTEISIDGLPVTAASTLSRNAPLLVLNSKSPDLLTESASNRRALLDRTLFHVEQAYIEVWKAYRQVLKQRNEVVRTGARKQIGFWNRKLADLAETIDFRRRSVTDALNHALAGSRLIATIGTLQYHYSSGWDPKESLLKQLEASWERDVKIGRTLLGAHRADLSLNADGRSVSKRLSRGQSKIVICSAIVALARFVKAQSGKDPVILIDDLAAELDDNMRSNAVDMINALHGQCVYTAIKPECLPEVSSVASDLFHVKRRDAFATELVG